MSLSGRDLSVLFLLWRRPSYSGKCAKLTSSSPVLGSSTISPIGQCNWLQWTGSQWGHQTRRRTPIEREGGAKTWGDGSQQAAKGALSETGVASLPVTSCLCTFPDQHFTWNLTHLLIHIFSILIFWRPYWCLISKTEQATAQTFKTMPIMWRVAADSSVVNCRYSAHAQMNQQHLTILELYHWFQGLNQ